ncbi:MAG: cobyrinate a,c-diamide synthase [Myxococcales bacterium]|nr:cobyrinate a,c-diamide synthase [Myxococcales bacterium]
MTVRTLVIGGTHSGVGKTSVAIGLMAALRRRGLAVQPFKVGPDFIDPSHHLLAAGRPGHNLDGWMLSREANLALFCAAARGADVAVVEGCMGLFDGYDGSTEAGSTAQIAKWLGAKVLLVVDAWAMSRSAAAMVHGYRTFDSSLEVAGVVFNKLAGRDHLEWVLQAVGPSDGLWVGGLFRDERASVPERHLGLHMPEGDRLGASHVERLAEAVETQLDLDRLLKMCAGPDLPAPPGGPRQARRCRLGVARDEAFCFYYQDNLQLLAEAGAELVFYSPTRGLLPPGLDGLYLGGGYPELHAPALAANQAAREQVRELALAGRPIYAECGGLMYLAQAIEGVGGENHPMCGVLPCRVRMSPRLKLGYAEVEVTKDSRLLPEGTRARGHFFHHSELLGDPGAKRAYRVRSYGGAEAAEGYGELSVLASYVHLHFRSNPAIAPAIVEACRRGR